jgi:hypothetical protein
MLVQFFNEIINKHLPQCFWWGQFSFKSRNSRLKTPPHATEQVFKPVLALTYRSTQTEVPVDTWTMPLNSTKMFLTWTQICS